MVDVVSFQQRSVLETISRQMSVLSSLPTETAVCLKETFLPRLLEATALQRPPSFKAHVGTQTMLPRCTESEPLAGNSHEVQSREIGISDQSVPSIIPPIPVYAEDERLFEEEGGADKRQQQQQEKSQQQQQHHQQVVTSLSSKNSFYSNPSRLGSSGRSCVRYDMDPSPVYDLDLTQLPMVIEKETCDSVRIERKVVYGTNLRPVINLILLIFPFI